MKSDEFAQVLEKVAQQAVYLPKADRWLEALRENRDYIALVEWDEVGEIETIRTSYGTAPQNLDGEPISRNFHDYLTQVINLQIARGEMTDGSRFGDYDERKARWSGAGVTGNWFRENQVLFLEIGPTTYPRYALDLRREKTEALRLMLRGLEDYRDPYAYFSKAIGVTVVAISEEGSVYIGERSTGGDNPGLLNFVAGLVTFHECLENLDFYADVGQELKEEIGIDLAVNSENTRFIGIAGNPWSSENDLVFITKTSYQDRHFATFLPKEHRRFVPLGKKSEIERLLIQGLLPNEEEPKAIAYGSRLALEYLQKYHW